MKGLITVVLAAQLLAVAAFAQTSTPPVLSVGSASPAAAAPVNAAPQAPVIHILTPVSDEKFSKTNSVKVRYEVLSATPSAGTPNFLVQLDGDAPVRTRAMEQSFSELIPGTHRVSVQLADANNNPISDSRADVQFAIAPHTAPALRPAPITGETEALNVTPEPETPEPPQLAEMHVSQTPPPEIMSISSPLPSAGSALPLISVIGFGVLVGGIASAMKTR
jgi:hypothetical protein